MKVRSCVLLLLFVFENVQCKEVESPEDTREKNIFMPFVYLRNYTDSRNNYTLQLPVIFIPVIILPLSQTHNLSQHDDNLSLNNLESLNDIEVNFRQSLNRGAKVPNKSENKTNEDLDANKGNSNKTDLATNKTNELNTTLINPQNNITDIEDESQTITNNNPYLASNYDNKLIDSLALTTTLNEEMKLPAVEDKRWKNFTVSANNSMNKTSTSNNLTTPKSKTNRGKGYPVALYKNSMIDQISITTNSYNNVESSTSQNDRWVRFSSLTGPALKPNGFKPLAGLYYDGFLHTPLIKMPGFNPHGDYYYP